MSFNFDATNSDPTEAPTDWSNAAGEIAAGNSVTFYSGQADGIDDAFHSGDTIRVVWSSPDGGSSIVLTEYEVN